MDFEGVFVFSRKNEIVVDSSSKRQNFRLGLLLISKSK